MNPSDGVVVFAHPDQTRTKLESGVGFLYEMLPRPNGGPAVEDLHDLRIILGQLLEQVVLDALVDGADVVVPHPTEDGALGLVVVGRVGSAVRVVRAIYAVRLLIEVGGDGHRPDRLVTHDLAIRGV